LHPPNVIKFMLYDLHFWQSEVTNYEEAK